MGFDRGAAAVGFKVITSQALRPADACLDGQRFHARSPQLLASHQAGARSRWALVALAALASALGAEADAQPQGNNPDRSIFTCVDAAGRRLTADRPIAACNDREQRVLNADGSLRRILPPQMTADERAAFEEVERRREAEMQAKRDAIRRDRNLLARFPDEAAHQRAREAALDDVRNAVRASEQRLADLNKERKPLMDEAEFYNGRTMPPKLRNQIDAVDVALVAQRATVVNQQAEIGRITALFDAELAHLRRLWAGAQPGSIGKLAPALAASAPRLDKNGPASR